MSCRGLVWLLGMLLVLDWSSSAGLESTPPSASDLFSVHHTPVPVLATRNDDEQGGYPMYIWRYRTEVSNDHPFPIRIMRFGTEVFENGQWVAADAGGRPFNTDEFEKWYSAADPASGGWIAAGQSAADSANWYRSIQPVPPQSRWYFVAVDSTGKEYLASAMPELCPYQPTDTPWASTPSVKRVPITLLVDPPPTTPSAVSQLRFERLSQDLHVPPPAIYSWQGGDMPAIEVGVPGIYLMRFQATGYHPWALPIIMMEDDPGFALTWRPSLRGKEPPPNEQQVDLDAAHGYLEEIWRLQCLEDEVLAEFAEAYEAHRSTHEDAAGFDFDWSPLTDELGSAMSNAPHEATRRFAAWLASSRSIVERELAAQIVELLPARSPLWSTDPKIALHAAFDCGKLLERDLISELAAENPDHFVQAHAIASLAVKARANGDEDAVTSYRARLDTEFADVKSLAFQRRRISPERKVLIGKPSPPFRVKDLDTGEELSNATFAGRYLLVHFWATWCAPCRHEMPAAHQAVAKYSERGLEIVSFSVDRKPEDVMAYRQEAWKLPWKQAFLPGGLNDAVAHDFEAFSVPWLVLIDPDGVIVAVNESLREENLSATLEKWIGGENTAPLH